CKVSLNHALCGVVHCGEVWRDTQRVPGPSIIASFWPVAATFVAATGQKKEISGAGQPPPNPHRVSPVNKEVTKTGPCVRLSRVIRKTRQSSANLYHIPRRYVSRQLCQAIISSQEDVPWFAVSSPRKKDRAWSSTR